MSKKKVKSLGDLLNDYKAVPAPYGKPPEAWEKMGSWEHLEAIAKLAPEYGVVDDEDKFLVYDDTAKEYKKVSMEGKLTSKDLEMLMLAIAESATFKISNSLKEQMYQMNYKSHGYLIGVIESLAAALIATNERNNSLLSDVKKLIKLDKNE